MTIREAIASATQRLKSARIPEPRLEAESLLAHVLKRDLAWLLAHPEAALPKTDGGRFSRSLARRARRVPFAQIVGEQGFYGRMFTVTKDVLIPRPETELLIEAVVRRSPSNATILDVGTGSGAIGLTLAAECPKAKAILYDLSRKALSVAKANAERLKLRRRVRLARLDILSERLPEPKGPSVIVANLPYLPRATWKAAQPEVRLHEPKLALVSGRDGLKHYRALFNALIRWKRKPLLVALEAEHGQFEELSRLARADWPEARLEVLKDLHGDARALIAENQNAP